MDNSRLFDWVLCKCVEILLFNGLDNHSNHNELGACPEQ